MTAQTQLAAHCRLATEMPEYADEHQQCRGTTTVTVGGGTFTAQRCDCTCHTQAGGDR